MMKSLNRAAVLLYVIFCCWTGRSLQAAEDHHHDELSLEQKSKDKQGDKQTHQTSESHKLHKAHTHGVVALKVMTKQDGGIHVHMDIPLESLVGFEHKPKNDQQQTALDHAEKVLSDVKNVMSFAKSRKCQHKTQSLDLVYEAHHAEAQYRYEGRCEGELSSQKITILMASHFSRIKQIRLTVVPYKGVSRSEVHKKFPFDFTL